MKTTSFAGMMAVALAVVVAFLVAPSTALAARGGGGGAPTVTVAHVPGANPLDPNDAAWAVAPVTTTDFKHINYVDTACGSGTLYELRPVSISGIHNGTTIYFRLDWNDPTADLSVADPNLFADAVALEVPIAGVGTDVSTTIQMGSQNNPVNIIMWRADWAAPQNIIAGGIGTVQRSPDAASQNIVHSATWAAGFWTVIIARPMASASPNQVTFSRGMKSNIAFMNVDGTDFERDGHKTISQWLSLVVQ